VIGAVYTFPAQNPDAEKFSPNRDAVSTFLTNMWINRKDNKVAKTFVEEHMDELIELRQLEDITLSNNQGIKRQLNNRFFNQGNVSHIVDEAILKVKLKPGTKNTYIFIVDKKL